ncbi:hypothetical protein [Galactobacter caseinivorans]|nr:hypothetical protein [Galactobacter caseinivorans]
MANMQDKQDKKGKDFANHWLTGVFAVAFFAGALAPLAATPRFSNMVPPDAQPMFLLACGALILLSGLAQFVWWIAWSINHPR